MIVCGVTVGCFVELLFSCVAALERGTDIMAGVAWWIRYCYCTRDIWDRDVWLIPSRVHLNIRRLLWSSVQCSLWTKGWFVYCYINVGSNWFSLLTDFLPTLLHLNALILWFPSFARSERSKYPWHCVGRTLHFAWFVLLPVLQYHLCIEREQLVSLLTRPRRSSLWPLQILA